MESNVAYAVMKEPQSVLLRRAWQSRLLLLSVVIVTTLSLSNARNGQESTAPLLLKPRETFSFAAVQRLAQRRAASASVEPNENDLPEMLKKLGYDQYRDI